MMLASDTDSIALIILPFVCFSFYVSAVFQLPESRMLSYFGIVPSGSILDVPNAALGVAYYVIWWSMLSPFFPKSFGLLVATLAMSSSLFLATRLIVLAELCVLCWSTHIINARLWWSAFSSVRSWRSDQGLSRGGTAYIKEPPKIKRV
jgi:hypothetical protein